MTRDNRLLLVVAGSIVDLDGELQVMRGNMLLPVVVGSVVSLDGELQATRGNTLLLVVMSSIVGLDWRVASDERQYVASCCHEQHRRFGLVSCKLRGTICCFLLSRAASSIQIGKLQVMRDNMLLPVVAGSIVGLDGELQATR